MVLHLRAETNQQHQSTEVYHYHYHCYYYLLLLSHLISTINGISNDESAALHPTVMEQGLEQTAQSKTTGTANWHMKCCSG